MTVQWPVLPALQTSCLSHLAEGGAGRPLLRERIAIDPNVTAHGTESFPFPSARVLTICP